MKKIEVDCALCGDNINTTQGHLKRRLNNSKSGLLFCSKDHKNQALRLGRQGDTRYAKLVPQHYGTESWAGELAECPGCYREYEKKYAGQIYCSIKCGNLPARRQRIQDWLDGNDSIAQNADGSIKGWAREYLIKEVHYACSICRWSEVSANGTIPLEIDHIDGNWKNSARENLRVLCPNCHSLTKNYKIYNVGNNEQSRYSYWREKGWH